MYLLDKLATIFFDIFGITHPSEKARRRATWFLIGMLMLVAIAVVSGGTLLYHLIRVH